MSFRGRVVPEPAGRQAGNPLSFDPHEKQVLVASLLGMTVFLPFVAEEAAINFSL